MCLHRPGPLAEQEGWWWKCHRASDNSQHALARSECPSMTFGIKIRMPESVTSSGYAHCLFPNFVLSLVQSGNGAAVVSGSQWALIDMVPLVWDYQEIWIIFLLHKCSQHTSMDRLYCGK